jgi:type IV secretory pathway VirB2 component (pilin)
MNKLLTLSTDRRLADVLAVLDPGEGVAPPGSEGFVTIVNWVAWIAVGLCVVGVILAGIGMLFAGRRGEGGEHAAKLGWVLGGSIVIGGASALVGAVV